ncbi:MAG: Gfo/Idh/MocA family oxidoreductase, partial [bacterium]
MAKDIRIGIVGCGQIATVEHAPALSRLPGVRLAAFCDIVKSKREHFRDTFAPEAAVFSSLSALLKTDLDAVVVSVPNYLHCRMTLAALKAGLHVLCEKPMAGNLADAAKIVAAARRAHRIVHVNQSLRYSRFHTAIADLIRKGSIGQPIHIRCIRGHGTTPDKGWSPGAKWFVSRKAQGGVIFDIGVHMADMLQWWFGRVDEISAVANTRTPGIDVPDHVASVFRFSNGATGILELSWA